MKKGFTLIELLVVVLIIGILSAIALPQYQKAILKARFVNAKVLATSLAQAQRAYFLENDAYATKLGTLTIEMPPDYANASCAEKSYCNYTWGRLWIDSSFVAVLLAKRNSDSTYTDYVGYIVPYATGEKPYCYVYDNSSNKAAYHGLCASETGRTVSLSSHTYTYP